MDTPSAPQPISPTPLRPIPFISPNLLLALVALISLIFGGYFIYQNQLLQKRLSAIEASQAQNQVTPTPTPETTSGFQNEALYSLAQKIQDKANLLPATKSLEINSSIFSLKKPNCLGVNFYRKVGQIPSSWAKSFSNTLISLGFRSTTDQNYEATVDNIVYNGGLQLADKDWDDTAFTGIEFVICASANDSTDETTNWKTYTITPDPVFELSDYQIKTPSSWEQIAHSSNFQNIETFVDNQTKYTFRLVINQDKNLNPETSKPYQNLRELTGLSYDVDTVQVDGQTAAMVLPRAGRESDFKVVFFSKDNKLVVSIELNTPRDGSKVDEGKKIFGQVLSTFKFLDCGGPNKTSCPTGKACRLSENYNINPNSFGSCVSESEAQP